MGVFKGSGSLIDGGSGRVLTEITSTARATPGGLPPPPEARYSVALDGTGYLLLDAVPITSGSFSIGGWFKVSALASRQAFFSTGSVGDIEVSLNNAAKIQADVNGSSFIIGSTSITVDSWHHGLFTYDSLTHTLELYLDGVSDVTGTQTALYPSNDSSWGMLVGIPTLFYPLTGLITDLFVSDTVLSGLQAADLFAGTLSPVSLTGLLGCWRLTEGSGRRAADSSGAGNNATLTGGCTWSTDIPSVL